MNQPGYDVLIAEDRLRYEFVSVGRKGAINKIVEYTYLTQLRMWNLGFGDFDTATDQVSDTVVSNNGDERKIMATVIKTLLVFFQHYPDETVIFTGSDDRRTIAYKRIILQHRRDFADYLLINGLSAEGVEQEVETDIDSVAFIVRKNKM